MHAFDHWTGRYIGPLTEEIALLLDNNLDTLDPFARSASARFSQLLYGAIHAVRNDDEKSQHITQTLVSVSKGIKHEVETREAYLQRLTVAIGLIVSDKGQTKLAAHEG